MFCWDGEGLGCVADGEGERVVGGERLGGGPIFEEEELVLDNLGAEDSCDTCDLSFSLKDNSEFIKGNYQRGGNKGKISKEIEILTCLNTLSS